MPNSGGPVAVELPLLWSKVASWLSAASGAGVMHLSAADGATHLSHALRIGSINGHPCFRPRLISAIPGLSGSVIWR